MTYQSNWEEGPVSVTPLDPPHGRPVFSLHLGNSILTGSADHGIRQYTLQGKYMRELFNKKYGHKEWVTTIDEAKDGTILSGGMDSQVCYWESKAVKCDHFLGHEGSISKVQLNNEGVGISASYDCSVIIWDLLSKKQTRKLFGPHKQAVMNFEWTGSLLVSGDKKGNICYWDLPSAKTLYSVKNHKGSVSEMKLLSQYKILLTTGLNDGRLVASDIRSNKLIFDEMVHTGSVNCLDVKDDKIATGSADQTINVFDLKSFKLMHKLQCQQMVNSVRLVYDLVAAVTDHSNLLVYKKDKCLYGCGVMKTGVCRQLKVSQDCSRAVCAGQDPSGTLLKFK